MAQLLSSKIIVEEEAPKVRNAQALPTAVTGFIGITERGPVGVATLVNSIEEYTHIFGGHVAEGNVCAAIKGYFDNGGSEAWIVRTVHYSDIANAGSATSATATKTLSTNSLAASAGYVLGTVVGPFDLEPSQTIGVKVDGGGTTTATFTAVAATRTSANTGTYSLTNGDTLTVAVDGGSTQTITFATASFVSIAAATAAEVAAVINASIVGARATVSTNHVVITSDKRGTASSINVTGGAANTALSFTTGATTGTGNVANIDAVTVAEVKTVVELAVAGITVSNVGGAVEITVNSTGSAHSVQVDAASTADTILGLDNAVHAGSNSATLSTLTVNGKSPGTYANSLRIKVAAGTSGDTDDFDLSVLDSAGLVLEGWPNLTMDSTSDQYVETIVNAGIDSGGSKYIAVADLDAATTTSNRRPANGTSTAMSGGGDGLSSLSDTDFIGDPTEKTGLRAFDDVLELTLLTCPDRAVSAVQNAVISYCEVTRAGQVFAIFDPPAGMSATGISTYVTTTAGLMNLSEYGGMFWPRFKIANPSKAVFGNVDRITIPLSGHVAGVIARTDGARVGGIYDAAANSDKGVIFGVLELETKEALQESKRDLVFPKRINPLRKDPTTSFYIDGARTLKATGSWGYIPQRRGVSFIEQSLRGLLDIYRHKNNTPELRAEIARVTNAFLLEQLRRKAFATSDPTLAYFVDCGAALNPQTQPNTITLRVGLAMATPGEFIVIRVSQDTRLIEAELAAATS